MRNRSLCLAVMLSIALHVHAIGPTTKANDDSCDIALLPAATLLLPYFEVDLTDPTGQTTLFSVTNVTNVSQIARVTLWTDFGYPVTTFNIHLTGYDVQSINLYDVLAKGVIAGAGDDCGPGVIPGPLVTRMQTAFNFGYTDTCINAGNTHEHAVGYATIDVVGNCSSANPADAEYFANDIRYDNALVGDFQQISLRAKSAQVNPMVHIRAIPEGGTPQSRKENPALYANRFSRTFYSRFQPQGRFNSDARQPLPSRFVMRWIKGGPGSFGTSFKIWRQSVRGSDLTCGDLSDNHLRVRDIVAFDENENGEGIMPEPICDPPITCPVEFWLPNTYRADIADDNLFPQTTVDSSPAGWLYLNLDDLDGGNGANQAWVVVSMNAEGMFSGDMDAAALGNGCSPAAGVSEQSDGDVVIGPSPNGEPEP